MEYKEQVNELKQLFNQNYNNMTKSQIVSFTNKLFEMMINREKSNEASFDLMHGFYLEKCKREIILEDITNSKCDVRKYMKVFIDEETKSELMDNYDVDYDTLENIIDSCSISVDHESLKMEIEPFSISKWRETGNG